jgi:hypothetical protein|tara:strand:+ start:980 stop:1162 length:183 start_codon:yes stop_codon:yes gene_type:complete
MDQEYNITSAKYVSSVSGHNSHILATIDGTEMAVPLNSENRHYAAILEWVADGNTIKAAS